MHARKRSTATTLDNKIKVYWNRFTIDENENCPVDQMYVIIIPAARRQTSFIIFTNKADFLAFARIYGEALRKGQTFHSDIFRKGFCISSENGHTGVATTKDKRLVSITVLTQHTSFKGFRYLKLF